MGIFVEIIENKCEGMEKRYKRWLLYFDEKQYALVGATSHQLQLEMKFTLKLKCRSSQKTRF
jgi:hypothetical protein